MGRDLGRGQEVFALDKSDWVALLLGDIYSLSSDQAQPSSKLLLPNAQHIQRSWTMSLPKGKKDTSVLWLLPLAIEHK